MLSPMGDNKVDVVYERQWSSLGNLIRALTQTRSMGTLYGGFPEFRYTRAGIPREIIRTFPFASLWNYAVDRYPATRSLHLEEPRWIGNWVARQKNLAPAVLCNGTAHRFLFPKLKDRGHTLILERGSMHPEDFFRLPQMARKEAGYRYNLDLPREILDEIEKTKLADLIITGSESVRQSYLQRGFNPDRVQTCQYGIDTAAYPFITRSPAAGRPLRVAIVGVIGFRKGLFRLLKLGEWAKKSGIPLELHFAGPIQDAESHAMFARSQAVCHLHGIIKGADLHNMLAACDLYCLPSYEEGLPFSVLEAMSTGLAAIVSTDTGASEVPVDGISGVHLTSFSDGEFETKLGPLLRDPLQIVEMGGAARTRIEEDFTFQHYCERIAKALACLQKLKPEC